MLNQATLGRMIVQNTTYNWPQAFIPFDIVTWSLCYLLKQFCTHLWGFIENPLKGNAHYMLNGPHVFFSFIQMSIFLKSSYGMPYVKLYCVYWTLIEPITNETVSFIFHSIRSVHWIYSVKKSFAYSQNFEFHCDYPSKSCGCTTPSTTCDDQMFFFVNENQQINNCWQWY